MKELERTFSPSEVCDLHRTTLFRWELIGFVPKVARNFKGNRVYGQEQIEYIYLRVRLNTEENIQIENKRGNNSRVRALKENMSLVEFMVGDRQEGLANLTELAKEESLSKRTERILLAEWLNSYKNGRVIKGIPALMILSDSCSETSSY